jgi:hypothetical protein
MILHVMLFFPVSSFTLEMCTVFSSQICLVGTYLVETVMLILSS